MKTLLGMLCLGLALAGCGENGDKPLARGSGLGYDWTTTNPKAVLRVSVQNSFTRDAVIAVDGEGRHYEVSVGPVRDAFMVIPRGTYAYSGWSYGKSLGLTKLQVIEEERHGIAGVLLRIRP